MADRVKPIAQSEKRIDAAGSGSSGVGQNIGNHNERFNDYQSNGILYPDSSDYNHIEGTENHITSGSCNSISGQRNSTGKNSSIVGGYSNENNSNYAIVGGIDNKVEADGSLTAGEGLLNTFGGQRVVLGTYNKQTGAPFIFGGGRSDSERDNLLELDGSGNLRIKGNLFTSGERGEVITTKTLPYTLEDETYVGIYTYRHVKFVRNVPKAISVTFGVTINGDGIYASAYFSLPCSGFNAWQTVPFEKGGVCSVGAFVTAGGIILTAYNASDTAKQVHINPRDSIYVTEYNAE